MRALNWLLRAIIFFTLFAFALNNQQEVTLHWFFGFEWRAPLVIVLVAAFAAGCAIGVLAMVPRWWRQRRVTQINSPDATSQAPSPTPTQVSSSFGAEAAVPPREGL